VEMDRVLTSPCFDFPLYSIEKRRIVKCSKCFYVSSLQAHKLNSIGSGKLPVVKLDRAPNTDVLRQVFEQGALLEPDSSTRATRSPVGYKKVQVDRPTESDTSSSESTSSSSSVRIRDVNLGLPDSLLEGDHGTSTKKITFTRVIGSKDQSLGEKHVSIVERNDALAENREESKLLDAAHIAELIGTIRQTGDENEARQIARVIQALQEREAWFQGKRNLQAQVGGRATEQRSDCEQVGDVNDSRLQPVEWLLMKPNDTGATSDVSGFHSADNNVANDPPTSTVSRHVGEEAMTKINFAKKKNLSQRSGSGLALSSGSGSVDFAVEAELEAIDGGREANLSTRHHGGGLSLFHSRVKEDTGRPAMYSTSSDLINYIARVSNEPVDEPEPRQSDPPIYDPQSPIRLPQEPCGTKAKHKDPRGRRRLSAPSLSSKLTNPHRKNPNDGRLGVGTRPNEIYKREQPEIQVAMEPEECRKPDALRSQVPCHHVRDSELQAMPSYDRKQRMLASIEVAAAQK
jgi:hypothetical protein